MFWLLAALLSFIFICSGIDYYRARHMVCHTDRAAIKEFFYCLEQKNKTNHFYKRRQTLLYELSPFRADLLMEVFKNIEQP
ncbi:MAG TPA: hypothetical protein VEC37_12275 [Bacillota bacterium]|nr:hypothetical protein [Bacillota bacterium]